MAVSQARAQALAELAADAAAIASAKALRAQAKRQAVQAEKEAAREQERRQRSLQREAAKELRARERRAEGKAAVLARRKARHEEHLRTKFGSVNKVAEEKAKQLGLPTLEGTSLQIAWANNIRVGFVKALPDCLVAATGHLSAAWWIRRRRCSHDELAEAVKEPPARM